MSDAYSYRGFEYRGFVITFSPAPIGIRDLDWSWVHKDYDGPGDNRCGSSFSLDRAKAAIDELLDSDQQEPSP